MNEKTHELLREVAGESLDHLPGARKAEILDQWAKGQRLPRALRDELTGRQSTYALLYEAESAVYSYMTAVGGDVWVIARSLIQILAADYITNEDQLEQMYWLAAEGNKGDLIFLDGSVLVRTEPRLE